MKSDIEAYRDLIIRNPYVRLGQRAPVTGADKLIIMGLVAIMILTWTQIKTA